MGPAYEDRGVGRVRTKRRAPDFPSGTIDKSPPVGAGVTGLIPGPGRLHMPSSN